MQNFPECLYWLGGSIVAAVVIDLVVARLLLEFLRPAYANAFVSGRAGKVAGLTAWLVYVAGYWLPQYVPAADSFQAMIKAGAAAVIGVAALLAFTSMPRSPIGKAGNNA